jgi:hypothetical protein
MLLVHSLVALFSLMMLVRHGPRALLFLMPRAVRVTGDVDAPSRSTGQVAAGELLEPLGFRRLGVRRERGPLGGLAMEVDAWAHADGTCADVYPVAGRDVAVAFLTSFADGFQLATSNFRRKALETAQGRLGGLEGAALEGALAAHRKAAGPLSQRHGAAAPVEDLAARIEAARRFYAGVGGAELRRPAGMSLLNSVVALLLLATSVKFALRALGYLE